MNALQHGVFERVKLIPLSHHQQNRIKGGLAEPDKFPIYARHNSNGKVADDLALEFWNTPENLEGDYIFGGLLMPHFGHFIAECVHRLWIARNVAYKRLPIIFMAGHGSEASEALLPAIKAHFDLGDIIVVRKAVEVERLIIAEQGKHLGGASNPDYIAWLSANISTDKYKNNDLPKKLFVTRSHMTAGSIIGERHIEEWLIANGYSAFRPEDYDLATQLSHIVNAEKIIFTEGSALHLLDLLPPITADVLAIHRRPITNGPQTSLEGKVIKYAVYKRVARILHNSLKEDVKFDQALSYLNIDDLKQFIRENQFVSNLNDKASTSFAYAEELTRYYQAEIDAQVDGNAPSEQAIQYLLDMELDKFADRSEIRYKFHLSRGLWALNIGAYEQAAFHITQALDIYPKDKKLHELNQLAAKGIARCATKWGRLFDRLLRSCKTLFAGRKLMSVQPPQRFYDRS